MPDYQAKPGQEDRNGEMTGAISVNMMMSMLPVTLWVFLSPLVIANFTVRVVIAVVLAIVLPLVFLKPSRWVWAWISEWMDR